MKKNKSSFYRTMASRFIFVGVMFGAGVVLFSSNGITHKSNMINNTNGVKSIEATQIITKYDNRNQTLNVRQVSNMEEVLFYGPDMPVSFTGQMTAYYPNCEGCTGYIYCPPRQNVTNGNIYFEDNSYGSVRILAADYAIPCGTIVKITNLTFTNEPVIGIVLDRGGAINGNIMDFLVSEIDDSNVVGRQKNVNYEILRWGW